MRTEHRAGTFQKIVAATSQVILLKHQAFGLSRLDAEASGDPIMKDREKAAIGPAGRSNYETATLILTVFERASHEKAAQPQATAPGTETK